MAKKSFFNSSVEGIIKGFDQPGAGEGAGRRPKPVRICAANTRTSHRPYHMIACEPVSLWDAGPFFSDAVKPLSCGGIVPVLAVYQPI